MVVVKAPAKINLCLDILTRLDNGYHSVWMIMQSVGLHDRVTVEKIDSGRIELTCDNDKIPNDYRNIAWKAAIAFFEYTEVENTGIKIHIEKKIPFAAGLAGGSADAAAVIVALNRLFETDLSEDDLLQIGIKVGADVPFCIVGGTKLAEDMGQIMAKLPSFSDYKVVIAKPDRGVSTKEAYEAFDSRRNIRHLDRSRILHYSAKGDYEKTFKYLENIFEQLIEVPERVELKDIMREHSAEFTLMSGSGPSVYGVFKNEKDALECAEKCKKTAKEVFCCDVIAEGCKIEE